MDKRKADNMDYKQELEKDIRIAKASLGRAKKAMEKASAARMALSIGSSRASVTTANARLNTWCEAVDRYEKQIADLYHKLVTIGSWD